MTEYICYHNLDEHQIILAGIDKNGYVLARKLKSVLSKISSIEPILCRVNIDKKNPRINLLKGILLYKKRKFKDCIKTLAGVTPVAALQDIDPLLPDNLYYYLALAHYYLGNTHEAQAYYEKVYDDQLKAELAEKMTSSKK